MPDNRNAEQADLGNCARCRMPWVDHGPETYMRHYLEVNPEEPVVIILREDAEDLLRLLDSLRVSTSWTLGASNVVCVWAPNIICPEHGLIHGGITG